MGVQGPKTGEACAPKAAANSSISERKALKTGHWCFIMGWLVLIPAVLVTIGGDWVLGIGGVIAIVVNLAEAHVAVHESNNALGIAIERHILPADLAPVPGQWRVRGPFHHQQRPL